MFALSMKDADFTLADGEPNGGFCAPLCPGEFPVVGAYAP